MEMPQGYSKEGQSKVCKVKKSLDGLKQTLQQWNSKLSDFIVKQGFQQSKADYSLFKRTTKDSFTAVLVYMDDIIVVENDTHIIFSLKSSLELLMLTQGELGLQLF